MSRIWQMSITETSLERSAWIKAGLEGIMSKVGKPVLLVEVVEEEAVPLDHHSDGHRHAVLGTGLALVLWPQFNALGVKA